MIHCTRWHDHTKNYIGIPSETKLLNSFIALQLYFIEPKNPLFIESKTMT